MQVWKCPICGETYAFGIIVGGKPHCDKHTEAELIPVEKDERS